MAQVANETSIVHVEALPMAAVVGRIRMADIPTAVMPMMDEVWAFIRGGELTGHGHNVWLYRNMADGEVDLEIGVQMATSFDPDDPVVRAETPAGMAAHTCHYGEYDQLPQVHSGLVAWCAENGHQLTGVSWEVYGDWEEDPAKRRTDIYHLCASAETGT